MATQSNQFGCHPAVLFHLLIGILGRVGLGRVESSRRGCAYMHCMCGQTWVLALLFSRHRCVWPSDGRAGLIIALLSSGHLRACPSVGGCWLSLFSPLGAGVLRGQAWAAVDYRSSLLWASACVAKRGRLLTIALLSSGHLHACPSVGGCWLSLSEHFPAVPRHAMSYAACHAMQSVEAAQEQRANGELW